VSNTYAAPFGFIANTWAYMDAGFGEGETTQDLNEIPTKYLWFADRNSNPAYRTPRVFVCFEPLATYDRLNDLNNASSTRPYSCAKKFLATGSNDQQQPHLELVRRDEKRDLWAIYKIQWNNRYSQD